MRYAQVVYLTAPAARPVVTRAAAALRRGRAGPGRGPGPAARRVLPGTPGAMSVLELAEADRVLWLMRKAVGAGWLAAAPRCWCAVAGDADRGGRVSAAWLRGWPPARLYRAAAWALPVTAAWLAAAGDARPGSRRRWRPAALAGRCGWAHGVPAGARPRRRPGARAGRPGRGPGRAGAGRAGLGVAELRRHRRAGRHAWPRPRSPSTPGSGNARSARPGAAQGARRRPAAGPGREDPGRRDHPRRRPPLAPGLRPPAAACAPAHGHRRDPPGAGRRT